MQPMKPFGVQACTSHPPILHLWKTTSNLSGPNWSERGCRCDIDNFLATDLL